MIQCTNCGATNRPAARFCLRCGSRLVTATPLQQGAVVQARYKVLSLLGQGGMGAVYLVEDQKVFGKRWALKEMLGTFVSPADRAQAIQQFEQEAKMLVSLSHPNLPQVSDYFSESGRQYLAMEHIAGETLEAILQKASGFLPEAQVVDWAVQICEVLEYLHSRKPKPVIFRDLKPANIMLTKDGKIKLIDFGIARLFDPAKKTDTLKMGTAGYAPPEQYAGRGQTDARSDIYGLGATMHHLLTKRDPAAQPFVFPPCRSLNSAVSGPMTDIISKATNVDPDKRYQSAAEMKQALLAVVSGAVQPAQSMSPSSTVGFQSIQWVQASPLPMFRAYCIHDSQETTWVLDQGGGYTLLTCLECDESANLGSSSMFSPNDIKGVLEAYCSNCGQKTTWVIHKYGRTCLGCSTKR